MSPFSERFSDTLCIGCAIQKCPEIGSTKPNRDAATDILLTAR
jgi:hypothetical protein